MERTFNSDDVGECFGFVYVIAISRTNDNTLGESIFGVLENHQGRNEE